MLKKCVLSWGFACANFNESLERPIRQASSGCLITSAWPLTLRLFSKWKSIILHSAAVQCSIWFYNRKWPRKYTNYYTKSIIIKIKPSIEALPPRILWRLLNFVFEVQLTMSHFTVLYFNWVQRKANFHYQ